jgi:hypothetical protein
MRGLDVKQWGLLDWIAGVSFAIAAVIPAFNAALKDAPAVADKMPTFLARALQGTSDACRGSPQAPKGAPLGAARGRT